MGKSSVNIGSAPDDNTGDPIRSAFNKLNLNHDELYALLGNGTTLSISGDATMSAGAVTVANDSIDNNKLANITRGSVKVGGASNAPTDLDAKGDGKILIGDGTDIASVSVSGDIAITNSGAATIQAGAVENSMLADDAVGADELASNAVVTASIVDDNVTPAKINILQDDTAATDAHILVADGTDFANVAVSGDIAISNTGATTIQTNAVEAGMINGDAVNGDKIADDSIDSEHYADGSIDTAHIGDDQVTPAKINILDDSLAATDAHIMVGDGTDFGNVAVSGDVAISNTGAVTIQADAVEGSMLNDNSISGQTEMTGDVADADELMVSDGGTLKRADFSVVRDAVFNDVSGDATVAAGGALTIANDSVEHVMLENRYTAVGTITNTQGATSVDWSAAAVYVMNAAIDGAIEFDFTGFKAGQVLTIYNISGSHAITLDSDAGNSESFLKVGGVDYDGSATSILQVECLADGADAVFAYSVAHYASDQTP